MLRLGLIFAAISICFSSAFAQAGVASNCPTFWVTGPSGMVNVGELADYFVTIGKGAENYPIEFVWATNPGRIKEGQGTRWITVIRPTEPTLVVSVEIKGIPANCPSTGSERG